VHGEAFTHLQLFESAKLAVAKGYNPKLDVWLAEKGTVSDSVMKRKRALIQKVGSRVPEIGKAVAYRQAMRDLEVRQAAEDKAAKAEGREPEVLTLSAGAGHAKPFDEWSIGKMGELINKAQKAKPENLPEGFDVTSYVKDLKSLRSKFFGEVSED
jgi:hypothetical protein